jgi:hypothetical protein
MWAPGITGASSPAEDQEYFFSRKVSITGTPVSGTIWIACDDFAEVMVNSSVAGTCGSVTNQASSGAGQAALQAINISPYLHHGVNDITIRARNGPAAWASCAGPHCKYLEQPAGVVFCGEICH